MQPHNARLLAPLACAFLLASAVASEGEPNAFELLDAQSAVGREFPLSPSMLRQCKVPGSPGEVVMEHLKEMSREARDIRWAREMEQRIEAEIARVQTGPYEVRALECRTTYCAVEVASTLEPFLGFMDGDPVLDAALWFGMADLALERDADGNKIYVTINTYKRR